MTTFPVGPSPGGITRVQAALVLAIFGIELLAKADAQLLSPDIEPNSPAAATPGLDEPGLSQRALPSFTRPQAESQLNLESFYWETHPFENAALMVPAAIPGPGESFRPVTTYAPPLGLRPKIFRRGPLEFYPWAGIAQSFDSNVQLTSHHQISDFYTTPWFGLETQLGTPDSVYIEGYDTIFATHLSYEGHADIFFEHPNLSAYNQQLDFNGRIGRDRFILRPFLNFSDITGNNLMLLQLQNRLRRLIVYGGVVGEYAFTPVTSWRQTYSALDFGHTGSTNINYVTWSTRQELMYLLADNRVRAVLWLGAEDTGPSKGSSGNQYLSGIGWQGEFCSRMHSELRIGWGELQLNHGPPGRRNMSGLRYGGYSTFDFTDRLRMTLVYDRDYVYNENSADDNYVTTMTQLKVECLLGDNWLLIPRFGASFDNFETSRREEMDLRPELEFAYVFGKENYQIIGAGDKSVASRTFIKMGYDYTTNLRGVPGTVEGVRVSTGFNWNF